LWSTTGSTDASADKRVRVLRQAYAGVSAALNPALRQAQGEFVLFHDADDRVLPSATAVGLEAFADHPTSGFVYGSSRHIDEFGEVRDTAVHRHVHHESYLTLLQGAVPVPPSAILFRRSVVASGGGFARDQALAEDYELYLRIAREYPIHCHGQIVAEYRWHGGNASGRSLSRSLRAVLQTLNRQGLTAPTPELVQTMKEAGTTSA
jgi:glycosyltransferase involved in cell wall biosynthesis